MVLGIINGMTVMMRIWYQNKNVISWLDGEFYVMSPDLINIADSAKSMPLLNPDAEEGVDYFMQNNLY